MISAKISTNPESFNGLGQDRRIGWWDSMNTPL
jgi:hypothetical protein